MSTQTSSIVFMGSPEFAVPSLRALHKFYEIRGVITQPDRPSGRGQTVTPPAVKITALDLNLPVIQPRRLRDPEAMDQLREWGPDLIVVAAYGQILRQDVLDLPQNGCINVHASLLPRWRGAAPIQAAILNGDDQTGVTIMRMEAGVDTGPILKQSSTPIGADDTAGMLGLRLANRGAELLIETLPEYLSGLLQPIPQEDSLATFAPLLKKEDGILDFTETAVGLERKVRAFQPWPGAFTYWQDSILKVFRAKAVDDMPATPPQIPGKRTVYRGMPAIWAGKGLLILEELQPAGKRSMNGQAFLSGARGWV